MPGLRYGSDFTDDAEMVRQELNAIKRIRRRNGRLSQRQQSRLNRLRQYVREGYGNERTLNQFARYSRARQGFAPTTRSVNVNQIRQRGYRGDIGRFRGTSLRVRARPAIPRELLEARKRQGRLSIEALERSTVPKRAPKKAAKRVAKKATKAKKAKKAAKKAPAKRQSRRSR